MPTLSTFIGKILFESLLAVVFITFFFFLYIDNLEKETFLEQISLILHDLYQEVYLTESAKVAISQVVNDFSRQKDNENIQQLDADIDKNNKQVQNKALSFVVVFLITICFVLSVIIFQFKADVKGISKGVFTLLIVGLVEYVFAKFFASRYRAVDTNDVLLIVIDEIHKLVGIQS